MNPNELRQKKAEALATATRLNDELQASDLTDEQKDARETQADEQVKIAAGFEGQALAIEAKEAAAQKRARDIEALQTPPAGRKAAADDAVQPTVSVDAPNFEKDPMKGFETEKEYLTLVFNEGNGIVANDARMEYLAAAGSDEQMGRSDPFGGFLLPEGMSPTLHRRDTEDDPFVGKTTPIDMSATSFKVNAIVDANHTSSVSGGTTVARSAETASKTASRVKMEQVKFEANSQFGFSYTTEELLHDAPGTVVSMLQTGFALEFKSAHIIELLRGTGVGMPEGVQTSPALVTVAKEGGQAADTIVSANIIQMRAQCYGYSGAFWLYNHDCLPQLMTLVQEISTAGGVPLWQFSLQDDHPDRLLGRPAIASEYAEKVGDLHDIMLIVPSAIYEGTYQPLQSAESMHIRFDRHERAFKFWQRNDARSLWRAKLTPNKSSQTLGPFVSLAARA